MLWQHIHALDLAHPPPDTQPPVPDEFCYGFLLRAGDTVQQHGRLGARCAALSAHPGVCRRRHTVDR